METIYTVVGVIFVAVVTIVLMEIAVQWAVDLWKNRRDSAFKHCMLNNLNELDRCCE